MCSLGNVNQGDLSSPGLRGGHEAQGQSDTLQGLCMLRQVKQGCKEEVGVGSIRQLLPQETVCQSLLRGILSCPRLVLRQACLSSLPFTSVNSVRLFSWISLLLRSWNLWLAIIEPQPTHRAINTRGNSM